MTAAVPNSGANLQVSQFMDISRTVCKNLISDAQSMLSDVASVGVPHCRVLAFDSDAAFNSDNTSVKKSSDIFFGNSRMFEDGCCEGCSGNMYMVIGLEVNIEQTNYRTMVEELLLTMKSSGVKQRLWDVNLNEAQLRLVSPKEFAVCEFGQFSGSGVMTVIEESLFCVLIEIQVKQAYFKNTTVELTLEDRGNVLEVSLDVLFVQESGYETTQNKYFVCKDIYANYVESLKLTYENSEAREIIQAEIHGYSLFSFICTMTSLFCLMFTLMTYVLFSELRTMSGKNNILLSSCLFVTHSISLYLSLFPPPVNSVLCRLLSIILHYFWLAIFCSMNICSWYVFRSFSSVTKRFDSNSKGFWKNLIYVTTCPAVVVVCVVSIHAIISDNAHFGYGETTRFLDNSNSLLFGFLVPAALVFLLNIVFLSLAVYKVHKFLTLQSNGEGRRELKVCANLCAVTGIAWMSVFVDSFLGCSIFSFVATFFNAFQGVSVCIALVLNKKVFDLLRKGLCLKGVSKKTPKPSGISNVYIGSDSLPPVSTVSGKITEQNA